MASNPPGACCFKGFLHEGTPKGEHKELFGVDTYVSSPNCGECSCEKKNTQCDKVIVVLTDVFGNVLPNACLVADDLAKQGFQVLIPDILFQDFIDINDSMNCDWNAWMQKHSPEVTKKIVDDFMVNVKKTMNPKFLGVIGYCFGAKFAVQHLDDTTGGVADCGAVAHPSFVSIEEVAAIKKPILISASENDSIFPSELRHQTEDKLKEIGARYQLDLFSGVDHGFACRGDVSKPVVKYAKEKVLIDQIHWFKHFSD